jgi:malate dehydrogenase (oxaloacetate-decarboxylating)(NADP+)
MIFAYSNPTSRSECTAEQAYTWSAGRAVFAGGSPFAPVRFGDRIFVPGQGNNVYVFPAIGMAAYATGARRITDEMFIAAASGVAEQVTPSDIAVGLVYPPVSGILETELRVAARVAEVIFDRELARVKRPADILAFIRAQAYVPHYGSLV